MNEPKISIITPSFNQVNFIEKTIQSVLDQQYPNLEYIIIDGTSTDGSVEIIQKYQENLSFWVSEPDSGQADALAKGFSKATGDIMGWLCSDDLLEPGCLWDVAELFQKYPHMRAVYGDTKWIDSQEKLIKIKKELPFNRFIWLYEHNFIPQPSTFWRKDLYEQVGGLDSSFNLGMDADLWIRFNEVTTLHHIPKVWSCMRMHAQQKTSMLVPDLRKERQIIRTRYVGDEPYISFRLKKFIAKVFRVGWKVVAGCYW